MKTINLLILICLTCIIISCKEKEKHCIIKGKIINRDSKALILRKACLDFRTDDTIRIPIIENTFSFEFTYTVPEAYSLIFEEELIRWAYKEIIIFPVDGELKMELFDMKNSSGNRFEGSELTTQYYNITSYLKEKYYNPPEHLLDSISVLKKNDAYYSDTMKILNKRMDEIGPMHKDGRKIYNQIEKLQETGNAFTPSANRILKQLNEIKINVNNEMYNYIEQHPDIVSFYMLIDEMKHYKSNKMYQNINTLNELQEMFAMKFKDHPYTKLSQELMWSIENIKVGGNYFDFTLSDINGKSFTISKEIEGKYSLVIFWAPWCSPCIASSRYMIPVFEDFKDKGFTIVGVAGKYKNINEVKDRLQMDKYPWITLIDPDWESSMWTRYGLKGSGGESFLIDDKGKIIAIYPSSDEVRDILTEKLK